MGLKVLGEEPFQISYHYGEGSGAVWIHDFSMMTRAETPIVLDEVRDKFHECFARVFAGHNADDGFNKLVLGANLDWRQVLVLRATASSCCRRASPSRRATWRRRSPTIRDSPRRSSRCSAPVSILPSPVPRRRSGA